MQRYVKEEINHCIAHQASGACQTHITKQYFSNFRIKSYRKSKPHKV